MHPESSTKRGPSSRRLGRLIAIVAVLLGLTMVLVPCVLMTVGTIVEALFPGA